MTTAAAYRFTRKTQSVNFFSRTHIMGVLNVTPDSFFDGGKYFSLNTAVPRAMEMIGQGADIIDVGGESTRPKGVYDDSVQKISEQEELDRVIPVIEKISLETDTLISIDTTKSGVAEAALKAGASIINDISGLQFDREIAAVASKYDAGLVLMHIQGTPETMQENPRYDNVVSEVKESLRESIRKAVSSGVSKIIIDPGIGFGKNLQHNLSLIRRLGELKDLGFPILLGPSRKGFIGLLLNTPPADRLEGTAASVAVGIMNGANIVRVHDVKEMKRVAVIVDAIRNAE